ncbi:MAG: CsgG/HfaB family protein [Aphanocapsa sp. GSE-SYN-MK-11-07L]|nr:CsgG/HfaB family protein [Aphanocapsa sp. GSE-SYN-MK-11-07L]
MRFISLSTTTLLLIGTAIPCIESFSLTAGQVAQAQTPTAKRRIAVLDFDYASTGMTYGGYAPSKGVSDLLTNKLVQNGTYSVIERSRIDQILQEQNLGASGRVDPATAAQIGKILGVDVVVIGSITQYNVEEKDSGGSLGFFGVNVDSKKSKATVQLTARLVSTSTAEILAVAQGEGQLDQNDSKVFVLGTGGGTSSNKLDKLLSAAASEAVDNLSAQIVAAAPKIDSLPAAIPAVNALVADVTGNLVTINKGSGDGFQVGMKVSIERVIKQVKDPSTGAVLRTMTQPIGQMVLTEVDAKSALGKVTKGVNLRVGDLAKPMP